MYYDDSPEAKPVREEGYDRKLMYWQDEFRKEAQDTARLSEELAKVPQYISALTGKFWDRRRPKYKSSFFANRMDKARTDNLAVLTDTRPTMDITTKRSELVHQVDIIKKIFEHEWLDKNMDLSLITTTDITKLFGTGFSKIGASYPGSMSALPCGPDSVMPVQPGFDIQESTGVLYKTWKAIPWVKRKFPFDSTGIEREGSTYDVRPGNSKYTRPDNIDEYVWNGLSPAMQRALGQSTNPPPEAQSSIFKSLEYQEMYVEDHSINDSRRPVLMRHPYWPLDGYNWWYWVQPGERLYPRKRLLIFAGRRRLYDGPSPFWHGMYPFACMRLNPVPWSFWGLGSYRNLLPINMAINDIVAGMLDMTKRALNPQAIAKQGSVSPAAWKEFYSDMPGGKLYMGSMANVSQDLRYMPPPEIPAYVFQLLLQYLVPEFDRMSNALDVGSLSKKKQVPAGDTIDMMRDSLNTTSRLEERYIEVFLRDMAQQALSNVFQFYTAAQRLRILGSDGTTLEDYDLDPGSLVPDRTLPKWDHWKQFGVQVMPGSVHGGSKDRTKNYAMQLFARGAIPLQYLYKVLEIPNPEELMQQLQAEHKMGIGAVGKSPRSAQEKKGA